MKTKISFLAICLFVIGSSFVIEKTNHASKTVTRFDQQLTSSFSFFRTHRQGKAGITSTWGLTDNTGVEGFEVKRTYEDPTDPYASWETVVMMPSTGDRSYKTTDENVFPGYITYKVIAIMNDGSEITSDMSTIHIVSH